MARRVEKESSRGLWKRIRTPCFRSILIPDVGGWHDLHFGPNAESASHHFCFEYRDPKLSDARNLNLSSESPCGMTFAWKHQFPEFRPPWRCNFRFSLWDLFCPKPGHRTSRKLHVTKKVSQLDISFTYPYPKWTVPV